MKRIILAIIGLGLFVQARGEDLTTTDGTTYNNISQERVDPDGLVVEYTLPGGGLGMSKVRFTRLSPELQKQYGYDEAKAKDFEAKEAKATEDYRQECVKWDEAAKSHRASELAQEQQQDKVLNDRIVALAQLRQAEANLAQVAPNLSAENYGWSWGGGDGYSLFALPQIGRAPRARTDYAPVVTPVPYPKLNIPNPAPHFNHSSNHPSHPGL